MFCTQCGQSLEADDKFCWNCGAATKKRSEATAPAKPATAAAEVLNVSSTVDMQRRVTHATSRESQQSAEAQGNSEARQPEGGAPLQVAAQPQLAFDSARAPRPLTPQSNPPERREGPAPNARKELPRAAAPNADPQYHWLEVPQALAVQPAPAPVVPRTPATPQSVEPPVQHEVVYDSVGNEIDSDSSPMLLGAADIPTPSFGGYAGPVTAARQPIASSPVGNVNPAGNMKAVRAEEVRVQKSRKPVLEIIVAAFLLVGAGVAFWILHASLPAKKAVSASAITVTISPTIAEVTAGRAFDFAATVAGTDDEGVTWTVQEGDAAGRVVTHGTKTVDGQVSSTAVYIAPNAAGTYHLIVASVADPQKSASAEINVVKR